MSELTPEEKQKIYLEEKERMEAQETIKRTSRGETYGHLLLILPFISTLLVWGWVGNMNLLQNPGSNQ